MLDKNTFSDLFRHVNINEIYSLLVALFGVMAGRISFWVNRQKRFPTWMEAVFEPVVIIVVGLGGAGCLAVFGVDNNLAYAGVGALSGHYGVRGIDFMVKAIASRFGIKDFDICPVGDDLKSSNGKKVEDEDKES